MSGVERITNHLFNNRLLYFRRSLLLLLLCFIISVYPVSAINAVVNGDFETGDYTGWTMVSPDVNLVYLGGLYGDYTLHLKTNVNYPYYKSIWQEFNFTDGMSLLEYDAQGASSGDKNIHLYDDGVIFSAVNCRATSMTHYAINISGRSGVCKIMIVGYSTDLFYVDNFYADGSSGAADSELYIAGYSTNQNWFINGSAYPDYDVYFNKNLDYVINPFNVSRDYYINCTCSNGSWPYTYSYLFDTHDGNSFNLGQSGRDGMKINILYPDVPVTYQFHLYELDQVVSDDIPWYLWPFYVAADLLGLYEFWDVSFEEIDTISVTLSRTTGDNETIPDIPEEPEEPIIPDPEPEPDKPINWTIPEEPPTYSTSNQSIIISWVEGYYSTVNNTIKNLCSPMYNFTNWSLSPIINLNSEISTFNNYMNASFIQMSEDSSILYKSINIIFNVIPPKIKNVITYYLIWVVLLIIFKKK